MLICSNVRINPNTSVLYYELDTNYFLEGAACKLRTWWQTPYGMGGYFYTESAASKEKRPRVITLNGMNDTLEERGLSLGQPDHSPPPWASSIVKQFVNATHDTRVVPSSD